MAATITIDESVRDQLKSFGTAGMTYNQILRRMMLELNRDRFVAEIHREANAVTDWIPLERV